ncbi:MAG: peptide-binding protein [Paracoccaceae bacterium]
MKWVMTMLLLFAANVGGAFELPALYDVTGVAANDVLNVRKDPTNKAIIIGELRPDASNIEVMALSNDKKWGLVNVGEMSGWAFMRFLQNQNRSAATQRLICYGNEPFWSLSLNGDAVFKISNDDELFLGTIETITSLNRTDRMALRSKNVTGALTAHIGAQLCDDSMSDRAYGLSVDALITSDNGAAYYSGCCQLVP